MPLTYITIQMSYKLTHKLLIHTSDFLPSVLVSCCRRVLAVMTSILWILQNRTTSLHSNWMKACQQTNDKISARLTFKEQKLKQQRLRLEVHSGSPSYLRINKVPLVVVKASFAEVTVGKRILQEVSSIQLVPCVLNLIRVKKMHINCR